MIVVSGLAALLAVTPPARALVYFSDSFDPAPNPLWTTSGSGGWHVADDTADPCFGRPFPNHPPASASSPNSYAYHFDTAPPAILGAECTYNMDDGTGNPVTNAGILTSPTIDLSLVAPPVWLHFSTWRETEGVGPWDFMIVSVDTGGGPSPVLQVQNPPSPQTAWEVLDVDLSFAAGNAAVTILFTFDTTDAAGNDYAGWYIDNVLVDDVPPPSDTLTFTPFDAAPATVFPGDTFVLMGGVDLTVDNNTATVDSITVGLTGLPPSDADISGVIAWVDNGDGFFDPFFLDFPIGFGFFFLGSATIPLFTPLTVTAGNPERVWITYDIDPAAVPGDFVGLSFSGPSSVTVFPPDNVLCVGCPFDTYVPSVQTEILPPPIDTVTITLVDLAPATAQVGDPGVLMAALDASVDNNTADLMTFNLTLTGLPPLDSDVLQATLWYDDGDLVFDPPADFPFTGSPFFGGVANLVLFVPLTAGTPQRIWITYDIDPGAVVGDYIGAAVPTVTDFVVGPPDLVACANCPFDTYVPGTKTLIIAATVDNLTFEPFDTAPATAQLGDFVLMGGMNLTADNNTARATDMIVTLTGAPPLDSDVSGVIVLQDDGDGVPEVTDPFVGVGFFVGLVAPITFIGGSISVTAGTPEILWILYQINPGAVVGDFVGLAINALSVNVAPPDNVLCPTCPMDTYVPLTKTEIVAPTADTVTFSAVDYAPPAVAPGTNDVVMAAIDMAVDNNTAVMDSLTVGLSGVPPSDADIALVEIWIDDGDLVFNPQDTLIAGGSFFGGIATFFFGFPIWAGFPVRLWVTYDIATSPPAVLGDFIGLTLDSASLTMGPPDVVACLGCPFDTYVPLTKTEITGNAPPLAENLQVDGFAPGSAGIGHILSATPAFAWTYFDPEGALQTDYEVRVSSFPGASGDMWMPGPAGLPGLTAVYAGLPLADGTDYYFAVRVMDDLLWSPWNETLFHTNGIPPAPVGPNPPDLSRIPADPAAVVSWTPGGPDPEGDAMTYDWEVSLDPLFGTMLASGTGAATSSIPFATLPGVTYYWRVRAYDGWEYSAWVYWEFTANTPPTASFPGVDGYLDGAPGILHILTAAPLFNWSYSDGDGDPQTDYEVRVGTASGLSDVWAPGATAGAALNTPYGGAALTLSTDYYLGVRLSDGIEWSAWVEVRFHTNGPPPPPTTPVTPPHLDPAVAYGPTTVVTWTTGGPDPDLDPVTYEWEVSTDPLFGIPPLASGSGAATASGPFLTAASTPYYWRARANDSWEVSAWSTWQFNTSSVPANLVPVASFPGVAGFLDGTAGILHIVSATPTFNWSYSDGDGDPQTDYEVRVGTASGLNDVWAPGSTASAAGSVALPGTVVLVDGTDYYLGVRVNDGKDWSAWVEVLFHTNTPPTAPPLVAPSDGNPNVNFGTVSLDWNIATDAEADVLDYYWQVSRDPGFNSIDFSGGPLSNPGASFITDPSTAYYWRVRANDGWEFGQYSAFDFDTRALIGSVEVTVTGTGGSALQGALVRLLDSSGTEFGNGTADANGVVRFVNVPALGGPYSILVTASGYRSGTSTVNLTVATPNPSVTVPLTAAPGGEQPPAEFPWWILALIAVVIAVLLILFLLLRRRKPKEEMAVAPATLPMAAEMPAPMAPGPGEAPASPPEAPTPAGPPPDASAPFAEAAQKLTRLQTLKDQGLISEAEFEARRKELLGAR